MDEKLLGVKINYVTIDQAVGSVKGWLEKTGKHYIVTPNPEMLVDADSNLDFKKALNEADLSIPDSPRLGWGSKTIKSKHLVSRLLYLPFVLFPKIFSGKEYPTTTGTDLMEHLLALSEEKGFVTAFLGGSPRVADNLVKCLRKDYPKLKIVFCSGNIKVDDQGDSQFDIENSQMTQSKDIKVVKKLDVRSEKLDKEVRSWISNSFNPHILSQKIDILFVAFGHKKQEKWMQKNLPELDTRVMIGVGGAFDYLSGSVPRAPKLMRALGLEWLFRGLIQPGRIKRFWKLPMFVYKVMTSK